MIQISFDTQTSECVKLIRTEEGLTQDEFAEMIGISKKTLVEVEKGEKNLVLLQLLLSVYCFFHYSFSLQDQQSLGSTQ